MLRRSCFLALVVVLLLNWRGCMYIVGATFPITSIKVFAHFYGWTWQPPFSRKPLEASCDLERDLLPAVGESAGRAPHFDLATGRCDCYLAQQNSTTISNCKPFDGALPVRYPNVTIVTALFDIGRTNRPLCKYLKYMVHLLRMNANIVIYASPETLRVVKRVRTHYGWDNQTDYRNITSWDSIPFSEWLPDMYAAVITSFPKHFVNFFVAGLPEHIIPEYDLMNSAKVRFLKDTITRNPFGSDYFFWMDAGAGHGETQFYDQWCPCSAAIPDKVTLLAGPPEATQDESVAAVNMTWDIYFEKHFTQHMYSPVGSTWGGAKSAVLRMEQVFTHVLRKVLDRGLLDDDQPFLALAYWEESSLFRLMPGHSHSFVNMC